MARTKQTVRAQCRVLPIRGETDKLYNKKKNSVKNHHGRGLKNGFQIHELPLDPIEYAGHRAYQKVLHDRYEGRMGRPPTPKEFKKDVKLARHTSMAVKDALRREEEERHCIEIHEVSY